MDLDDCSAMDFASCSSSSLIKSTDSGILAVASLRLKAIALEMNEFFFFTVASTVKPSQVFVLGGIHAS